MISKKQKKNIAIIAIVLFLFCTLAVLIVLPLTKTQFLLLRIANKRKPSEGRILSLGRFTIKYPDYIPAKKSLAFHAYRLGSGMPDEEVFFDIAIVQCEAILGKKPNNQESLLMLGDIYARKGDVKNAEKFYKKLLLLVPANSGYFSKLGSLYSSNEMDDELFEYTKVLSRRTPQNAMAHFFLAQIYEERKDVSEAIAEYNKAIKYFKFANDINSLINAYERLGNLYFKLWLFFDASNQFERIVKIAPKKIEGYLALADLYHRLGLIDRSISRVEEVFRISKRISRFDRLRAYLMLGAAYLQKGNFIAARGYFEKAEAMGANTKYKFLTNLRKLAEKQEQEDSGSYDNSGSN